MRAAECLDVEEIKCLAAAEAGGRDENGQTALMLVCGQCPKTEEDRTKQREIVQLLMKEAGQLDNDGRTAMMAACMNLNADVVELLCEKEAGIVKNDNKNTALMISCYQKVDNEDMQIRQVKIVRILKKEYKF